MPGSCYSYHCRGILSGTSRIDDVVKTMVPNSFPPRPIYISNYAKLMRHFRWRSMYNTMLPELYKLHMSKAFTGQSATASNVLGALLT